MTEMQPETTDEDSQEHEGHHIDPVAVVVVNSAPDQQEAPQFAGLTTFQIGATDGAIQILPQAPKREKATLQCFQIAAVATAYVLIGSRSQVQNGQGFRLYAGKALAYEAVPEMWAAPDGTNAVILSVADEKYR